MYGLITIMELIKWDARTRGLASVAMAAFIFLSALPMEARAQNTYGGSTVVHTAGIGLVPGQRVSVSVPNYYFLDGSVRYVKHVIRVTERESGLVYSGESGGLNESGNGHVFTIKYSDLSVRGEAGTGRLQLWIEVESFPFSATDNLPEDRSAVVWPPTFELIEELTGRTLLFGTTAAGTTVSLSLRARPELAP